MKRTIPLSLRVRALLTSPASHIVVGFVLICLAILTSLGAGYVPDIWNSRNFGPGWACTNFGKGAFWCAKNVPPELQRTNSN